MKEELGILEQLLQCGGMCLHGSKEKFTVAEPRSANCESKRPESCRCAVYATPDDVAIAIVRALIDKVPGARSSRSSYSRHGNGPLVVDGENATFTPGYVHILPSDTFGHDGDEYYSLVPVSVLSTVPVDPSILKLLDNIELRIPIPPPYS